MNSEKTTWQKQKTTICYKWHHCHWAKNWFNQTTIGHRCDIGVFLVFLSGQCSTTKPIAHLLRPPHEGIWGIPTLRNRHRPQHRLKRIAPMARYIFYSLTGNPRFCKGILVNLTKSQLVGGWTNLFPFLALEIHLTPRIWIQAVKASVQSMGQKPPKWAKLQTSSIKSACPLQHNQVPSPIPTSVAPWSQHWCAPWNLQSSPALQHRVTPVACSRRELH